ncbi:MAG: hypothetical protein Q9166_007375 [cf. Caloplaca sp. 2 TL-2023]
MLPQVFFLDTTPTPPQALAKGEDRCPVIVDEEHDLTDIEGSEIGWNPSGGLLGQADRKTALLSMSDYGKSPVNEYVAGGTSQIGGHGFLYGESHSVRDNGFIAYEQQIYAGPPMQPLPEDYEHPGNQLGYSFTTYYQPRAAYQIAQACVPETNAQPAPIVTQWYPESRQGPQGTQIGIFVESVYDLQLSSTPRVGLRFADTDCGAILYPLDSKSPAYNYQVISNVPYLSTTGSRNPSVLMCLLLQDASGMTLNTIEVGYFRYTSKPRPGTTSPQGMRRKQDSLVDSTDMSGSVAERTIAQQLSPRYNPSPCRAGGSPYPHRSRPYTQAPSSRYTPYETMPTNSRRRSSTYSSGTTCSTTSFTSPEPVWISSHAAVSGLAKSTALSSTPSLNAPLMTASTISSPPLFRISTRLDVLNKNRKEGDTPLTRVPHSEEAHLIINGDLNSMLEDWTIEEWKAKRRIVRFWRSQNGSTVTTGFAPVAPEHGQPKIKDISCIWCDQRKTWLITSVDTIRLVAQLVTVDGQVDTPEKNRIRRNVENLQPTTLHKDTPETGDLFRLVMGFTNPKARNIEKAVKVFPWSNLGTAITRIVKKYVSYPAAIPAT